MERRRLKNAVSKYWTPRHTQGSMRGKGRYAPPSLRFRPYANIFTSTLWPIGFPTSPKHKPSAADI